MFLSPDQRFLTSELFDTTLDPREQERRQNEALMTDPAQNKAAVRGPDNAPVTVVEFADFKCPFCRNLASMMEQVLPSGKVRVIFHHMPISSHAWARAAAVGAACAQLQSAAAFWAMHDQIFQHQHEITPKNVSQELIDFARMSKQVDMQAFQNCVAAQASLGLVLRDMELAAAYNVNATPTLFINGHRVSGVKDAHELTELIDEAEAENRSALIQPRL